ncbi:MAG: FRG domain-containing protein [Halioglobus sp.]
MSKNSITEYRPVSLAEYVDIVEDVGSKSGGELWYRGCSRLDHALLPSLYRGQQNPDAHSSSLSELESGLVSRFLDRSLPYRERELKPDLRTLFFMQHYGIPTRLLDWTENPFVGLFFALRGAGFEPKANGRPKFTNEVAVWILDPSVWNQTALSENSYIGGPLDPNHSELKSYVQIGDIDNSRASPVAIFGAHNSQRIVAQQGTFVIFGSKNIPMEQLYREGGFPQNALVRVVITKSRIDHFRRTIFSHGITEGSIFPDLEGLGRDLRRLYGFDI